MPTAINQSDSFETPTVMQSNSELILDITSAMESTNDNDESAPYTIAIHLPRRYGLLGQLLLIHKQKAMLHVTLGYLQNASKLTVYQSYP
jgi:hypothetical protein